MLLRPTPISTDRFIWLGYECERLFVADASDLMDLPMSRVYDDACDEGYTLVSAKTGKEVVVVVEKIEKHDGDLIFWELVPVDSKYRGKFAVRIYND
jgi:hypothetical protein